MLNIFLCSPSLYHRPSLNSASDSRGSIQPPSSCSAEASFARPPEWWPQPALLPCRPETCLSHPSCAIRRSPSRRRRESTLVPSPELMTRSKFPLTRRPCPNKNPYKAAEASTSTEPSPLSPLKARPLSSLAVQEVSVWSWLRHWSFPEQMSPSSISTVRLRGQILDILTTDTITTEEEAEKQAKELVKVFKDENPGADRVPKVTGHYCDGEPLRHEHRNDD